LSMFRKSTLLGLTRWVESGFPKSIQRDRIWV
jgi:hypothetical protein